VTVVWFHEGHYSKYFDDSKGSFGDNTVCLFRLIWLIIVVSKVTLFEDFDTINITY
jgi:hypothetical protein